MSASSPGRRLRDALTEEHPLLLAGVHDALSARLADRAGFRSLYLSGSATAMALLGLPDIGLLSAGDLIDQAARVTQATDVPLVCDADTGFGNAVNVAYTVRCLERAGAAGIQLEDQTFPKRCGHFDGKSIVEAAEMIQKLRAAVDARHDDTTVIVARTDARALAGIDEAIDRANRYVDAGADLIFVEAPTDVVELRRIAAEVAAPTLVNVVEGGKTPQLELAEYRDLGFKVVLYPTGAVRTVAGALGTFYAHLRDHGTSVGLPVPMVSFAERNEITGFQRYERLAARMAGDPAPSA